MFFMRIGEIARQAGLAPSTIRFYEKAGVLSAPERTPSGYRDYEPAILDRLSFIRDGQAVGLTLSELREIIAFRERGEVPCVHVIQLIRRRAGEIASQIDKLQDMRRDLQLLSDRAQTLDPSRCSEEGICQIIVKPATLEPRPPLNPT